VYLLKQGIGGRVTDQSRRPKKNEFLAGYLPYLLNRVAREMLRGVDEQFHEHGLTVSKWRVLAVLADRGKCKFGELARLTSVEPPTLSRFVGALVREGLVRRRRSSSDARSVTIALTEKGELVFEGTLPWALEVENTLVREIDPRHVLLLKEMLKQMYGNIHEELADPADGGDAPAAETRLLDR
jgi:DNA-binding MarR family transcriptional regulator